MRLALVGGGAMGEAIVAAVLKAGLTTPDAIAVVELVASRRDYLAKTYGVAVTDSHGGAVAAADLVLLAVKPQDFEKAAGQIAQAMPSGAAAVSIMAGVTVGRIAKALSTSAVVRAMPNTPAQIGEGMTVWTATPETPADAKESARSVFAALGREAFVPDEKYLDMATALSGSGPAYVFLFIEALIDAGVHVGLARDLATTMALQTVLGSARYMDATGTHPALLRNQVTSPAGTTAEALRALEAGGLRAAVLEAVIAAYNRSRALGETETK